MRSRSKRAACLPLLAAAALAACGGRIAGSLDGLDGPSNAGTSDGEVADGTGGADDSTLPPTDAASDATEDTTTGHDGSTGDASQPDGNDAASDAPADATLASDAACDDPCLVGDGMCVAGDLSLCVQLANGCTAWGPATACGADSVCTQKNYRASCVCEPGGVPADGGCVQVIGAPRLIAPLSTATVTSQTPTLHWLLAPGTDGAQIDVCSDRACSSPVTFTASGSSAAVGAPLGQGVHFWRARGTSSGVVGTDTSPVWELFVGARSAPHDTSWGTAPDVNGDGFADVLVGITDTSRYADVYVYAGGSSGVATTPVVIDGPTTGYGTFGVLNTAIASAGDVNGDGYSDVVVGVTSENAQTEVGAVNFYLGGPGGLGSTMTEVFSEGLPGYAEGQTVAVAGVGDVNGDGYADVLTNGVYANDEVYLLLGGPAGLSTVPITISTIGSTYGSTIGAAGDVNGDGYGDFLVAAGVATYLYLGGASGPSSTPITLPLADASHACADDVNGDGLSDLTLGMTVYFGDPTGLASTTVTLTDPSDGGADDVYELSAESAGDIDGDGYADILVVSSATSGQTGQTYMYRGGPSGPSSAPFVVAGGTYFGLMVSGAADVNGDGFADILVGMPGASTSPSSPQGTVSLYWGMPTGLGSTPVVFSSFWGYTFASLDSLLFARSRRPT
ncbi:MAG: FG-GAP-like repeat-containing protein [Polyangiaceae bacterium]